MKIAYLILAHNNPKHFGKLVDAISGENNRIFVHIDRKSDITPFEAAKADLTFCEDRVAVYWGDYTQVEAMLSLMRFVLKQNASFDYFVLLSGADYPIRSQTYIHDFFHRNQGHEFMQMMAMPCDEGGKPITRLSRYHLRNKDSALFNAWQNMRLALGLLPRERDYQQALGGLKPYAGATWWALTPAACAHIVEYADAHPVLTTFYQHTDCPDESLFHTILGNSEFAARIKPSVTYADWSAGGANPAMMSTQHVESFEQRPFVPPGKSVAPKGECLFARKFSDNSAALLEQIDRLIADETTTPDEPTTKESLYA